MLMVKKRHRPLNEVTDARESFRIVPEAAAIWGTKEQNAASMVALAKRETQIESGRLNPHAQAP